MTFRLSFTKLVCDIEKFLTQPHVCPEAGSKNSTSLK
jgi:hypothetical protein